MADPIRSLCPWGETCKRERPYGSYRAGGYPYGSYRAGGYPYGSYEGSMAPTQPQGILIGPEEGPVGGLYGSPLVLVGLVPPPAPPPPSTRGHFNQNHFYWGKNAPPPLPYKICTPAGEAVSGAPPNPPSPPPY